MVSSSKYEIQQSPPFWWWQPLDDGVKLNSRSLNKLPYQYAILIESWIQTEFKSLQYSSWILATRQHEHMHKLMHNMSCHQHTSPPLSSTKRRSTTIKCLWYKFNSLHEKHNIKFYHHAVLKPENLANVTSCLEHSSYQVLDMQVLQHTR